MLHDQKISLEKLLVIDGDIKKNKTMREIKAIKSKKKNAQIFQGKSHMQKQVSLSCKLMSQYY